MASKNKVLAVLETVEKWLELDGVSAERSVKYSLVDELINRRESQEI